MGPWIDWNSPRVSAAGGGTAMIMASSAHPQRVWMYGALLCAVSEVEVGWGIARSFVGVLTLWLSIATERQL